MTEFEKTLESIDNLLISNSIDYILIGGLAVFFYSSLRTTRDIDISILTELEELDETFNIISLNFKPIFKDSLDFFKRNFVLPVLDADTNIRIDFTAGLSEFDKKAVKRKKRTKLGNIEVNICSIEDLIIYKLVAARYQDFADIEELVKSNKSKLDEKYLLHTAKDFVSIDRGDVTQNLVKFLK